MSEKCKCPPGHSTDKIGHSTACPRYAPGEATQIRADLCAPFGSRPEHRDGTSHDGTWATRVDINDKGARSQYGVCLCGVLSFQDATAT